jgi:hypothetical protein
MSSISDKRTSKEGIFFKIAAWVLLLSALLISIALTPFVGAVPLFISYLFFRKSRKFSAREKNSSSINDHRAPVLYLRSFADETSDQSIIKYFKSIAVPLTRDLAKTTPSISFREQDALGYLFRKIGPYIALGKPGELLPELGSSKIYVANEKWQATILEIFKKAKLIIFRAGKTEGLKWELIQLLEIVNPLRLLMIMPVKDEDYFSFIQWSNTIMPEAFPVIYPSSRMITFDEAWSPLCLPQGQTLSDSFAPFFRQNGLSVKQTFWEKFLEQNGIRW